jgi:DNA-binding SARP family transcriptional activator
MADLVDLLPLMEHQRSRTVVHLFGGPYVSIDEDRIEVPEGSQRLLAFVALHRPRVERRFVAGSLWPDVDELRASGNLRTALWRLNLAGIRILMATRSTLSLRENAVVDVDIVDHWARRVIDGAARPIDLKFLPWELDAFDVLPGWYEDWALMVRERIRQRVLHALEALSYHLSRAGRADQAVDAALLAVGADPLRESAQRALIEAYIGEGNWSEANRRLQAYRELLDRELGMRQELDLAGLLARPLNHHSATGLPYEGSRR